MVISLKNYMDHSCLQILWLCVCVCVFFSTTCVDIKHTRNTCLTVALIDAIDWEMGCKTEERVLQSHQHKGDNRAHGKTRLTHGA